MEEIVNVLYGGQCLKSHCCGYCKRKGKYMTVKQMRKHECLAKQCPHFDMLEHAYWKKREAKLAGKKERKNELARITQLH